jgi:hypothetical protein
VVPDAGAAPPHACLAERLGQLLVRLCLGLFRAFRRALPEVDLCADLLGFLEDCSFGDELEGGDSSLVFLLGVHA